MRVLLVFALVVLCGIARADAGAEARAHYRHGRALFEQGQFDAARVEFEAGYRIKPLPLFLFNAAQAARHADDRARALELYKRFMAADPGSSLRAEAEQHIAELEPRDSAPLPPGSGAAPVAAPPAGEAVSAPAGPPPRPAPGAASSTATVVPPNGALALPLGTSAPAAPRRWPRDPAGGVLAGLGSAAAVAGGALLVVAEVRIGDAQTSYDNFDAAHRVTPLLISAGVTLGLSAALLINSAIRYGVVARRQNK
jgi:tetratricopeptide (TPR) repeat protein